MYIKSYKELIVWQKSVGLVREIYKATHGFPKEELYGLASQMRRAAVSIPSNIAEGSLRKNRKEYLQFLRVSFGSSAELETQILIAKEQYRVIDFSRTEAILEEVQKMLNVMIQRLDPRS